MELADRSVAGKKECHLAVSCGIDAVEYFGDGAVVTLETLPWSGVGARGGHSAVVGCGGGAAV